MSRIIGIGTDIVQIPRIEKLWNQYGKIFAAKILSSEELKLFSNLNDAVRPRFLAKRFAAKEAIYKAVSNISNISMRNIEVMNLSSGAPIAKIPSVNCEVKLSISDDYPTAIAFAVALLTNESLL